MELTYYWDALSDDARDWLNRQTAAGEKVLFATNPTSGRYLRQAGKLRVKFSRHDPGLWVLVGHAEPAGGVFPRGTGADRPVRVTSRRRRSWGIPLIWAFPYEELERARAEIRSP
jgi:hypothetical protein